MSQSIVDYIKEITLYREIKPRIVNEFVRLLRELRRGKEVIYKGSVGIPYGAGTDFSNVFELPNDTLPKRIRLVFWTCVCKSPKIPWTDLVSMRKHMPVVLGTIRKRPDVDVKYYVDDQGKVGEYWNDVHISGPKRPESETPVFIWDTSIWVPKYIPENEEMSTVLNVLEEYNETKN